MAKAAKSTKPRKPTTPVVEEKPKRQRQKRLPEVTAENAYRHRPHWLDDGTEVRPFKWDAKTKTVQCSYEVSPGKRKRDLVISYDTVLYTDPALVPPPPPKPIKGDESTVAATTTVVPTQGAPLPEVVNTTTAVDAIQRIAALQVLHTCLGHALAGDSKEKWAHFLVACNLNPDLRQFKSVLAQLEIDTRAQYLRVDEIMQEARKV